MSSERFDTDLAAERNVKKPVVVIQICLKEVIGNKLLLKATAVVNCGEVLWATTCRNRGQNCFCPGGERGFQPYNLVCRVIL